MNWIKNNPWKTFFIALAVIYLIISAVKGTLNPMNWFSSTPGGNLRLQSIPILDANGNATGRSVSRPPLSDPAKKRACEKVSSGGYTGWIGDCKFPISGGI